MFYTSISSINFYVLVYGLIETFNVDTSFGDVFILIYEI